MTRHDYELITDVLKECYIISSNASITEGTVEFVAIVLADALAQDNKAFDKDKFINDIRGQVYER